MKRVLPISLLVAFALALPSMLSAQGVTTASISGTVLDVNRGPLGSATVVAVHQPSGTRYGTISRADGRFFIPGMRVGGPYIVTASLLGYEEQASDPIHLHLGVATDLEFTLQEAAIALEALTVTATRDAVLSPDRTGAATAVSREAIEVMPTISRRIEDFARLTPQYRASGFGFSFAGQDNRLNNVTVDGSYFNNSFGLAGQPGDRTRVAPISVDAIEQIHVNIAPYDVRQGNFVGAGVNTVTRSGTNQYRGSLYYQMRDQGLVGREAKGGSFAPGTFDYSHIGGWLSGPILRDRLFFFVSYEDDSTKEPGTTWSTADQPTGGQVTRVEASVMNELSTYLRNNFGYETGPFQGYTHETPARRFLTRLDYNISERSKVSLRYIHLDSDTDVLVSNSSSLGWGTRRTNQNGLNFQNSNYQIMENIRSVVGEWNAMIGQNMSNSLIVGYRNHDESRRSRGDFFPMVDILDGGSVYTTFGFEPFTPNNELRYDSFQLQNNFTIYGPSHTFTFGVSAERYESENVFFPGSQSVYTYNSLDDFYTDANDYLANPNRTTSPVELRRFQVRWANIPGMEKPIQPLRVFFAGAYGQHEWQVNPELRITTGLRVDVPWFANTGFTNAEADALSFRDEDGNSVQYRTGELPDPNLLFSPRIGFNWDLSRNRTTQIRGGTGIFTGPPIYVWISNQIGNTGVLTGFERLENTVDRPFHPDPNHYKPTNVTGAPADRFELALTDPDFKYPQVWRSNLAVDRRLPYGLIGTAEFMYNRDVNGIYYINANLAPPNTSFAGADNRPRWTAGNRIHAHVDNAIVLKNQSEGYSWNFAASLERPFEGGLFAKAAYSYGEARNTVGPGSIAFGSWNNNPHPGDPNNPGVGFASESPGHRIFGAISYRRDLLPFGPTTFGLIFDGYNNGNLSYVFAGDINGDGGTSNDLIYIHANTAEMNFEPYDDFTAEQQAAAWEAFIQQDPYLRKNRGRYAERNGVRLPMVYRADLSFSQELVTRRGGTRNSLQLRADILNFTNFLSDKWGASQRLVTTQPLIARGADTDGRALYRLRNIGGQLISESFAYNSGINDVWRIQFTLRYLFN